MKTLTSPLTNQTTAAQGGWAEVYDFYLKSAITTPWGTVSTLRLTDLPGGVAFFTPNISPEPAGTRGNAQAYNYWPLIRQMVKADSKFANDKMQIAASNVTLDWNAMLAAIDWYDTPIVIRKISTTIAVPTTNDCAILWSGQVDAVKEDEQQLNFECSSDLSVLSMVAPRENMHTACRFRWADDLCTAIRFHANNYKAKTVGASSTTTRIKSAGLTEDSGSAASYGTDLVNALADGAITTSSEVTGFTNVAVTVSSTTDQITLANHGFSTNDQITFAASVMPGGLSAGPTYYVFVRSENTFMVRTSPGAAPIDITSNGTSVTISTAGGGSYQGFQVKSSKSFYWKLGDKADWGAETQGIFQIADAQAGIANGALTPYIQFDFGSAKTPVLWRVSTVADVRLEELVRLIVFFSSPDASTWTFESYFEIPPVGGTLYDVLIPSASTKRYWRICIRTRWAVALYYSLLNKVYAYETSRHYWRSGRVTFASNTTTVALRNISRRVLESYSGEVVVPVLPVAPANGDTFIIERGCGRAFNDCAARKNTENFGGFLDLPFQSVIR